MDKIDLITMVVSIISLIVPLVEIIFTLYKGKDEYRELKIEGERLRESIRFINSNSGLSIDDIKISVQTKDDYKMILYWYCYFIANKIIELYPKYSFRISIKAVSDGTVSTILTVGDELFIDDKVQLVEDNTEYSAIIKDGFDYFFVTDLHTFDEKKQRYITSDPDWRYKCESRVKKG